MEKDINHISIKTTISKLNNVSLAMSLIADLLENSNPIKNSIRHLVVGIIDQSLLLHKDDYFNNEKIEEIKHLLFSINSYLNLLYKTEKISKMNWSLISDYIRVFDFELGKINSIEIQNFFTKKEQKINISLMDNLTDIKLNNNLLRTNYKNDFNQNVQSKNSANPNIVIVQKSKTKNIEERKDRIINLLKMSGEMSLSGLYESFNGQVASKTIQRDMQLLASQSIVEISGTKRWTKYKLKIVS